MAMLSLKSTLKHTRWPLRPNSYKTTNETWPALKMGIPSPQIPFLLLFFNKANTKHDSQKSAKTISLPIYTDIFDPSLYGIDKMSSLTK